MLVYHPAYDAYHCLFRMMAIIERTDQLEIDKLKILDFYILFPSLLSNVKIPRQFVKIKKRAKKSYNEYHDPINPRIIFKEMRQIQDAAIKCMVAAGYIYPDEFSNGYILRTDKKLPKKIASEMKDFLDKKNPFSSFIIQDMAKFHLTGPDGLKSRTQLMEHRYDIN
ncbi:ABC-three component system middle component 5 [Lonsdalea quercina]|uniref:ABC-three component system middle component 5 n=1 Tax=Lonsdalea quercina TaxID=71657 RepID=UPI003976D24F